MDKFNYVVGRYWEGTEGQVSCYTYGAEVFYGTMKEAESFLEYISSQRPIRDWKIFKLVEVE